LFSDDLFDALFDAFHADLQRGKVRRIIANREKKNLLHVHAAIHVQRSTCDVTRIGRG
jgi:hypothetical protein